jgi:uncharacterized protein (TIRG00374 family)
LTQVGVPAHAALAALVADIAVGTGSQVLFVVLALVAMLWMGKGAALALPAVVGMTLLAAGTAGLVLFVKLGAQRLFQALERWRVRWRPVQSFASRMRTESDLIQATLDQLITRRRAVAWSCLVHLVAWFTQAGETWLVLRLLGVPVSFGAAFVLEALCSASRSAAFVIPGGLGVQEGVLVVLGRHMGIAPEAALTLGVVKRLREVVLGAPGLLAWSLGERRTLERLARRRGTDRVMPD